LLDSYFAVLENHSAKLGLSLGWQPWRLANRGLVRFSLYRGSFNVSSIDSDSALNDTPLLPTGQTWCRRLITLTGRLERPGEVWCGRSRIGKVKPLERGLTRILEIS
jgi:hypothetical protein